MSATPMLEIIAESGGAPRRRSGANAIRSSSTPRRPQTTNAMTRASGAGTPACITNNAVNAPTVKIAGWARFRMSSTENTRVKPRAKRA